MTAAVPDIAPFEIVRPVLQPSLPVMLAVPHAGRAYKPALLERMRHPEATCARLEDRLVDHLARKVARDTGLPLLVAAAPRAEIDLNRSPLDIDWSMLRFPLSPPSRQPAHANSRAAGGLGIVPRRIADIGEIWRDTITEEELERRIALIHAPYHHALGRELERLRQRFGVALLLDIHSMPPLPRSGSRGPARFVIGDRFGAAADPAIAQAATAFFGSRGVEAAHNRPYAGGYVLDRHADPVRGIHAVQLEICRSSYLDPTHSVIAAQARSTIALVADLVRNLGALALTLSDSPPAALAAE